MFLLIKKQIIKWSMNQVYKIAKSEKDYGKCEDFGFNKISSDFGDVEITISEKKSKKSVEDKEDKSTEEKVYPKLKVVE